MGVVENIVGMWAMGALFGQTMSALLNLALWINKYDRQTN